MKHTLSIFFAASALLATVQSANAQEAVVPMNESIETSRFDYGSPIPLALAKSVIAASEAEATAQKINVAISIVDSSGNLVVFSKADNTHLASIDVAQGKATTALGFRRATKLLQDAIRNGNNQLLTAPSIVAIEGGLVLVKDKKIIGAIGVSGGTSQQDAAIARAGIENGLM